MTCKLCSFGYADSECTLLECGHVVHSTCLTKTACSICFSEVVAVSEMDDLLLSLARSLPAFDRMYYLEDTLFLGKLASEILVRVGPSDPVYQCSLEASFHSLFDPEHTVKMYTGPTHHVIRPEILEAVKASIEILFEPQTFKKAKLA